MDKNQAITRQFETMRRTEESRKLMEQIRAKRIAERGSSGPYDRAIEACKAAEAEIAKQLGVPSQESGGAVGTS